MSGNTTRSGWLTVMSCSSTAPPYPVGQADPMRTLPVARTRGPLRLALAVVVLAAVAGLVLLRPDGSRAPVAAAGPTVDGRVVAVRTAACPDTAPEAGITCTTVEVRIA